MWGLVLTTILTSAVDSLNPFAITQQFVLQGMVKKPSDILYFIIPTGLVNLLSGYLAYYGMIGLVVRFFNRTIETHGYVIFTIELLVGIGILMALGHVMVKKCSGVDHSQTNEKQDEISEKETITESIKSVTPLALVMLGVGVTISELTTALPYFAFLTILFTYQLSFLQVTLILVLYNLIYMSPLLIMYGIYIKAQAKFDLFYAKVKQQIGKWSSILTPLIVSIIGLLLVLHSMSYLLAS